MLFYPLAARRVTTGHSAEALMDGKNYGEELVNRGDQLTLASPHFLGGHNFCGLIFRHSVKLQQLNELLISICGRIIQCVIHMYMYMTCSIYIYIYLLCIHMIFIYIYIYHYISGDLRDTRKDMPAIYSDLCQPHPTYFFCQFSPIN